MSRWRPNSLNYVALALISGMSNIAWGWGVHSPCGCHGCWLLCIPDAFPSSGAALRAAPEPLTANGISATHKVLGVGRLFDQGLAAEILGA